MHIHHVCVQTNDYPASLDFYTRLLGFEIFKETANFHSRDYNTWLRQGSFMIELQTPKAGESLQPWSSRASGPVHLAFLVPDAPAAYERLKAMGHTAFKRKGEAELYQVEGEWLFKIQAPEGTEIEMRDTEIQA